MAVTPDDFRRIALSLPGVSEGTHMGHADFRVRGRIFATLGWPDSGWGMVKLTSEEQEILVEAEPTVFVPVRGAWGRRGSTNVRLGTTDETTLRGAILAAWRGVAPKRG